jgi:dTDP-4-dehydrorhamnose 3,5-epimerase-like enzyme
MKNKIHSDFRGFNMKFFEENIAKEMGFNEVKEIFATTNKKGTIRAFHWQAAPKPQQKIVKPLFGSFNVRVIDMENKVVREYDNWNNTSDPIFVKAGNMLGYVALEENSTMLYIADEFFVGELNSGVNPMSFGVNWNYEGEIIMNDRDKLADIVNFD